MSDPGSDLNIILNLDQGDVSKKPPNPQKSKDTKSKNTSNNHNDTLSKQPKKRKYIDPKDFVPISTLFEKNPEIPKVYDNLGTVPKSQEVVFSSTALEDLPINSRLKGNLKDQFSFNSLTQIQVLSIPTLLQGKDAMIKSPTGSGKTMCYAIPVVNKLSAVNPPVERSHGPYAVVLLPTRELALQVYNVFQDLCKSAINIVPGLLVGGEKCKAEKGRLRKGINILIGTPGRLAYHLKETACLNTSHLSFLVLDEVDRLLDMGFKQSVIEIVEELEKRIEGVSRQTVLLSATLDTQIKELASITTNNPVVIDESTSSKQDKNQSADLVVPSSLNQYYIFVPAKLRLVSLFLFLSAKCFTNKTKVESKVIVFMPNKCSVTFIANLFSLVVEKYFTFGEKGSKNVFQLHGDMKQQQRFEMFKKFKSVTKGILFCTDVAARGLDIKKVNWIVQYSCPLQIEDYLHKVGRTARIGMEGSSLLFLLPSESEYVSLLAKESIILEEMKIEKLLETSLQSLGNKGKRQRDEEKATELQTFIEESLVKDRERYAIALSAYSSYVQSYSTYPSAQKDIFHVKKLHLGHIAKSFGLREAPGVFKGKIAKKESTPKEPPRKKIKKSIPEDGIFSGPRPGKQHNKNKVNNNKKKKKKLRV